MSRPARVVNESPKREQSREKQITVPQPTDHPQDHMHKATNALKIKIDHLKTFDALTKNQQLFFDSYKRGDYFIALHGVAGTGKTFCAMYKAMEEVLDKSNPFKKVIVVRSAVQGREIGHLPGGIDEKMDIYEQPYRQICETFFDRKDAWERLKEQGYAEFISTSFIRGCTWDNAIIILDECQNLSFEELHTAMTRVGHMSKIIVCGDYRQCDLKKRGDVSGLQKFLDIADLMYSHTRIEFTVDDIVRSSLVKDWIIASLQYEDKQMRK